MFSIILWLTLAVKYFRFCTLKVVFAVNLGLEYGYKLDIIYHSSRFTPIILLLNETKQYYISGHQLSVE